jgi:CheY-like chemotaxis protein
MSGYEVAREIRRRPGGDRPVLAAVTGYGQEQDKRQAREAGFDVHLIKPADPDKLLRLLAVVARHGRVADTLHNGDGVPSADGHAARTAALPLGDPR